jgi:hypothetical protein
MPPISGTRMLEMMSSGDSSMTALGVKRFETTIHFATAFST